MARVLESSLAKWEILGTSKILILNAKKPSNRFLKCLPWQFCGNWVDFEKYLSENLSENLTKPKGQRTSTKVFLNFSRNLNLNLLYMLLENIVLTLMIAGNSENLLAFSE